MFYLAIIVSVVVVTILVHSIVAAPKPGSGPRSKIHQPDAAYASADGSTDTADQGGCDDGGGGGGGGDGCE